MFVHKWFKLSLPVVLAAIIAFAAVASSYAFPNQSTVNQTHGGCQTSQTALASFSAGQYVLSVWHEDYNSCVGTVYSQARWHDGSQINYTSIDSDPNFAQPSSLYLAYYYYGYGWGESSADFSWWGTFSVDP